MEYSEAKLKFIHSWGVLGTQWGINKTMAQIHALLITSPISLNTDEIIEALGISRGNASMNIKALLDWGIVYKDYKPGKRKDYYHSEKDVWKLAVQIANERRRRELEPVIKILKEVSSIDINSNMKDQHEFITVTGELHRFASQADGILSRFTTMESSWFFGKVMRLFKR